LEIQNAFSGPESSAAGGVDTNPTQALKKDETEGVEGVCLGTAQRSEEYRIFRKDKVQQNLTQNLPPARLSRLLGVLAFYKECVCGAFCTAEESTVS
jgi:hypothetical protein